MEHNSQSGPGNRRALFAGAIALMLISPTACTPKPQDPVQAANEITRTLDFKEPRGGLLDGVIRGKCENQVWHGPRTTDWIHARPLLGMYADGRTSPAVDAEHLTRNDMAVAIDRGMRALRKPGWPDDLPTSKFAGSTFRSSKRYVAPQADKSLSQMAGSQELLRVIIASLGPPRYAYNPNCDGNIVLLYGDAAFPVQNRSAPPSRSTSSAIKVKTRWEQCDGGRDFLQVDILSGSYAVFSKKDCTLANL
jgi:hypothetical protein